MKIKNLINNLNWNNKNLTLALILLYISCVLIVVPFINAFVIRGFWGVFLACMAIGFCVFAFMLFCIYVFYKIQWLIKDLSIREIIVKSAFVLASEITFFAIFAFLTMLYPPLFMALGIVLVLTFCACNIYIMYNTYSERTDDKQSLFRFLKIYNISILTICVCIWLIC